MTLALALAATASGAALAQPAAPPASASAPASSAVACPAPGTTAEPVRIEAPTWVRRPDSEDWKSAYPPYALKQQKGDQTSIDCDVADDGRLQNCKVVSDKKPGLGFDKSSMAISKLYQMKPPSSLPEYAGLPECIRKVAHPHVVVPIDWHP